MAAKRNDKTGDAGSDSRPRSRAPRRSGRLRRNGRKVNPYWPLALAEVTLAILLALALPGTEAANGWSDFLHYDASTAQATLAAIASGMFTLTGFVLTAVTLIVQTVQGQSSRLLQALDRSDNKPVLFGAFVATFMFALIVLSDVTTDHVPGVSVTFALIMVLVCVAMFLRLLVTFRRSLTVSGLTIAVGSELRAIVDQLYPAPFTISGTGHRRPAS